MNAPVLPDLPLTAPVDWDALRRPFERGWSYVYDAASPFACAWHIACSLPACQREDGTAAPGWCTVLERDTIAIQRGHIWAEKIARGESSCAWHEIASAFGTRCACAKCNPMPTRKTCRVA